LQNGVLKADPLKGVKVLKPEGNRVSLTREDLKKLELLYTDGLAIPLILVLGQFLFSCYRAMRFSDVKNLRYSNLFLNDGNPNMRFVQQKTSSPPRLPLGVNAMKYIPGVGLPAEPVFNAYSDQKNNWLLIDIFKMAGITKPISFHCALHTFATLALEVSGFIELADSMCGHKKNIINANLCQSECKCKI